jgi:hypothetical protein
VVETNLVFLKDFAACSSHGRYSQAKRSAYVRSFRGKVAWGREKLWVSYLGFILLGIQE